MYFYRHFLVPDSGIIPDIHKRRRIIHRRSIYTRSIHTTLWNNLMRIIRRYIGGRKTYIATYRIPFNHFATYRIRPTQQFIGYYNIAVFLSEHHVMTTQSVITDFDSQTCRDSCLRLLWRPVILSNCPSYLP